MNRKYLFFALLTGISFHAAAVTKQGHQGYYRDPALQGQELVFSSEGDLWVTNLNQKRAHRLTSRRGIETNAIISEDGKQVAFIADYDGNIEAYVMPIDGGQPKQITFEQQEVRLLQWTKDGHILYGTTHASGPSGTWQLKELNPVTLSTTDIPLFDANTGSLDETHNTLYFSRFGGWINGDHLRAYHGGGKGQIWRYTLGSHQEATLLTNAKSGSSRRPLYYQGKIYYVSDRSGNPNLWSMNTDGSHPQQLTYYTHWAVRSPSLSEGHIVYQLGADLAVYSIADHTKAGGPVKPYTLPIELVSDQPYRQPRWISNPLHYASHSELTPDGDSVVITARGKVVIATTNGTRLIKIVTPPHSRVKLARMSQNGQWIYAICDASGEEQIWRFAADGSNNMKQLTHQGHSMRWSLSESPDGKHLLTDDKDGHLWLVDSHTGTMKKLLDHGDTNAPFGTYRWSHDSRYIAISTIPDNARRSTIILYDLSTGHHQQLTSERYNSFSADFSNDGKWLYFLSDRAMNATPISPWQDRSPDPIFNQQTEIFALALQGDEETFPFQPVNELQLAAKNKADQAAPSTSKPAKPQTEPSTKAKSDNQKTQAKDATTPQAQAKNKTNKPSSQTPPAGMSITWKGLTHRLWQVPVSSGNYSHLQVSDAGLYFTEITGTGTYKLKAIPFSHRRVKVTTLANSIREYQLSQQQDQLFINNGAGYYIVPSQAPVPDDLTHYAVDTAHWEMNIDPKQSWMQMFHSAWLMHRDMFYDPTMHGQNWQGIKAQLTPLLNRVSDRYELSDLLGQMISNLNTLHSQVGSGSDTPEALDTANPSCLGATLTQSDHGVEIAHIDLSDPELPESAGPLGKPGVHAKNGDILVAINRHPIHSLAELHQQLNGQARQQVLLTLKRGKTTHQTVVYPTTPNQCAALITQDWAEKNDHLVAKQSHHKIGYIYLQAMMNDDFDTFAREFYANLDKQGLIIDVRNNQGGNIDSWILDKLFRRVWMYWQPRHGRAQGNMAQVFRGHIAVIANQMTYSDGETFTAGFKALKIGPVIGKTTFGAGVWLDDSNGLTDNGIARVAEYPQYDLHGKQLIEQKGVTPDIQVSNLPYATFHGHDAQLQKAIDYLNDKIRRDPIKPLNPK